MKNNLKVMLKRLDVTPDPNDFTAIISYMGRINRAGVIDAIIADGTEYKRDTIEAIVNRYNSKCAEFAVNGWTVDTGLVYMRAIVSGAFYGKKVDPKRNSVYVSVTQGADIRREAAQTQIEVLGEMPDVMYILQVINMQTKSPDGTLARGRNALVEGAYLKLTGTDPAVGVYLVNAETDAETKLDDDLIVTNDPSKLMLLIPAELPVGAYRLKVVTQFTGAGKLLKAPREAVFAQELTVI
jgi:hypothetical protein